MTCSRGHCAGAPRCRSAGTARRAPRLTWPTLWHLQAGLLPGTVHAFAIHVVALLVQQSRDLPVAKARVLSGKVVNPSHQNAVFLRFCAPVALRRSRLFDHLTSPPLADVQLLLHVPNGTAARRA